MCTTYPLINRYSTLNEKHGLILGVLRANWEALYDDYRCCVIHPLSRMQNLSHSHCRSCIWCPSHRCPFWNRLFHEQLHTTSSKISSKGSLSNLGIPKPTWFIVRLHKTLLLRTYSYIHRSIYIYTNEHIHIYEYIYICMYIFIYMYINNPYEGALAFLTWKG